MLETIETKHKQFIAAVKTGAMGVIETLLNKNPELINYNVNAGSIAILLAAYGGHNSTIELLQSKGFGTPISHPTSTLSSQPRAAISSNNAFSSSYSISATQTSAQTYRPASTQPSRNIPITPSSRPTPTTHVTPSLQETTSTPAPINIPQPNPFSSAPPPFVHSSQALASRGTNIESIIAQQVEKITQQENILLQQNTLLQKLLVEMESVKQQNLVILNYINSQITSMAHGIIVPQPQAPNPLGVGTSTSTSITTQSLSPEQESTPSPEVLPQLLRIKEERVEEVIDEEGTDEELESPSLKRKRKEPIKSEDAQENTNGNKRLHVENLSQDSKPKSSRDTHPTTFSGRESTRREKNPESRQQHRAI
ncbi:hypothetical protein NF27_BF00070 [Candidatus Jidaibacter acanthamoeba]|uniref:Ankyrin repeat protein n=1 Tax=Candidatus Jidaibacter acanthamoebae TaxID=86105 RepID=A0A0C1R1R0_9RICK|nr:hypothetical protein [Candidatus Jidaibacter acanthamoeba]KIE06205.1 hypothetical protein NF27_BF00070 [Candidatus Jidaibacter acanthamoeba]